MKNIAQKTCLERHGQLVKPPGDVNKALVRGHLGFRANTLLEVHQAVVILARLEHSLFVVRLRILVPLAASETATTLRRNSLTDGYRLTQQARAVPDRQTVATCW